MRASAPATIQRQAPHPTPNPREQHPNRRRALELVVSLGVLLAVVLAVPSLGTVRHELNAIAPRWLTALVGHSSPPRVPGEPASQRDAQHPPRGARSRLVVTNQSLTGAASFPGTSGPGLIIAYRLGAKGNLAGTSTTTASSSSATVSLHSSPYGNILVDSKGYTLYLWAKDTHDKSTCTGACLEVWPDVIVSGKPTAGPGVNQKLLGTIKVAAGNEVTYNGWPLYTFVTDTKPGVITGEGNTSFGAPWWVVSAAGTAITKKP